MDGLGRLVGDGISSLVSTAVAVAPPTRALGTALANLDRSSTTVFAAASESAAFLSVPCSSTCPRATVGLGAGVPGGPNATIPSSVTLAEPLGESADRTVTAAMPS